MYRILQAIFSLAGKQGQHQRSIRLSQEIQQSLVFGYSVCTVNLKS